MSPKPTLTPIKTLDILKIRTDGGTQARVGLDPAIVQEYGELIEAGVELPPVRTCFDGNDYWLVDGFHRLAAAKRIGLHGFATEVFRGSLDDAKWESYAANSTHGVRRTAGDLEVIVKGVLGHPKSRHLSNIQIARHLNLPETTFRRWRKRLSSPFDEDGTRMAKRGNASYPIKTAQIGKGRSITPSRSTKTLQQDFDGLKAAASPSTRRILNIMGNWIHGHSDSATFLAATEGVIQSLSRCPTPSAGPGLTVWFTGLSSAGKSTISKLLCELLRAMECKVEWLDGDEVRQHLSKGLGFSKDDRDENVLRIGFLAERLTRNGVVTLVSAISPYRAVREQVRRRIGAFVEVYVHAPIEVCEKRDLKGIYRRARAGEMRGVTGIDDPYEPPINPEVECRTDRESPAQSARRVLDAIQSRLAKHNS